jgi:hypothetical protein
MWYDEAIAHMRANRPRPGCGHELKWMRYDPEHEERGREHAAQEGRLR